MSLAGVSNLQAALFSEHDLEKRCLDLLDDSALETLESEGFTEINKVTVQKIIDRDSLCIEEMDVYNACVRWAEAECKRQDIDVSNFYL